MRNIGELIKSYGIELTDVIPLILLFVFWWIFSLLTAKAKQIGKKGTEPDSPGLQERFFEALTGNQGTNETVTSEPMRTEVHDAHKKQNGYYTGPEDYEIHGQAKPIHPKWWAV